MNLNSGIFQSASLGDQLFLKMIVVVSIIQGISERKAEPIPPDPANYHANLFVKSKIRGGFTVRKAVVYSEILNRKYT